MLFIKLCLLLIRWFGTVHPKVCYEWVYIFADDMKLFFHIKSKNDCCSLLQVILQRLVAWGEDFGLNLNISKLLCYDFFPSSLNNIPYILLSWSPTQIRWWFCTWSQFHAYSGALLWYFIVFTIFNVTDYFISSIIFNIHSSVIFIVHLKKYLYLLLSYACALSIRLMCKLSVLHGYTYS